MLKVRTLVACALFSLSLPAAAQPDLRTGLHLTPDFEAVLAPHADRAYQSDIAFYEVMFSRGPVHDERLPFLFANAYMTTSQQEIGIAYFEHVLEQYGDRLDSQDRATHLAALALMRASHAQAVPFLRRIGWVNETIGILERAHVLSAGQNPLVYWARGIVYAQLPGVFRKRDDAIEALEWLAERPESEPLPGIYREAYRYLAELYAAQGRNEMSERFRQLSGYSDTPPVIPSTGWFALDAAGGLRFSPWVWTEEVVEDHVFAVRGADFSDLHFVISADRSALIAIDLGITPQNFETALAALYDRVPDAPDLAAVLVTHAHFDHIGGYNFIRDAHPDVTIYGRGNYRGIIERSLHRTAYQSLFRGADYEPGLITRYRPDIAVNERTVLEIGGSHIVLQPITSGESDDALLIHFPDLSTVFAGDTLMPFYGEPWTNEGFVTAAVAAIGSMLELDAEHYLHGHFGITVMYPDRARLLSFQESLAWLIANTQQLFEQGYSAEEIIRANLVAPSLESGSNTLLGYLAARDHVIRRIGLSYSGIWRGDSTGMQPRTFDTISAADRGRMLAEHFGLSRADIKTALRRMIGHGDLELALETAIAATRRFPADAELAALQQEAAQRLANLDQFFDPFSFVAYQFMAGSEMPPMAVNRPDSQE